jgi:Holliday junction resolvasome RuvABC endonuclease subunit
MKSSFLFLGIDPSLTGTGLSLIDINGTIVDTKKLSTPVTGVERLFHLRNNLKYFLEQHIINNTIQLYCIEGGAFREQGRIFHLGEWSGIIKLLLYDLGVLGLSVAPLQLKKFVSGVGKNTGKETIILDVYKNFNEEIRDNDIADAYVLSQISRYYYIYTSDFKNEYSLQMKKHQKDIISTIQKSSDAILRKELF